jgi:DNA repair protein RecN (Recombination protein N)
MVTLSMLQKISAALFDITGQHQQQSLLEPSEHRRLLDAYDIPQQLIEDVSQRYTEWASADRALNSFLNETSERSDYFRRIGLERDELAAAELVAGEREELEAELNRLSSVETLGQTAEGALDGLNSDEHGVEIQLGRVRAMLFSGVEIDPALKESYELIDSAYQQVKEGRYTLSDYLSSLEVDPNRLEFLRERIAEIARLERKYRKSELELIGYLEQLQEEISEYEAGHFDEAHLREVAQLARKALDKVEVQLTQNRQTVAEKLEGVIAKELKALNMKRARFEVRVEPAQSSSHGADSVEFFLSANPGEPARALAKVASGGELSRVLLVLKTLLNERASQGLQVFDEVDTGIGGAVAEVVGEKLKDVSRFSQVVLVTHAPQIAALADCHKVVRKKLSAKATSVEVRDLSPEERVDEVARMLAGKKVTARFQDSARELLDQNSKKHELKLVNDSRG